MIAGVIILKTKKNNVDDLVGIGKEMPITMVCWTLVSLGLVGIPFTSGFISKWYLATGSLASDIPVVSWLGPIVLLLSALLTAGYLFSVTIKGFFPGPDYDYSKLVKKEPHITMLAPIILFTILTVWLGMFPNNTIEFILLIKGALPI